MDQHEKRPFKRLKASINLLRKVGDATQAETLFLGDSSFRFSASVKRPKPKGCTMVVSVDVDRIMKLELGVQSALRFKLAEQELITTDLFLHTVGSGGAGFSVSGYRTMGFSPDRPGYVRLVIPVQKDYDPKLHFAIEQRGFVTVDYSSRCMMVVQIEDLTFEVLWANEDGRAYIFIDPKGRCAPADLLAHANAIMIALGYITGDLMQDEAYCFVYDDEDLDVPVDFQYWTLRDSMQSSYTPVFANAHAYMYRQEDLALATELNKSLRVLTNKEFSKLCARIHASPQFKVAVLQVIEAMAGSVLRMPSTLFVALEGICNESSAGGATSAVPKRLRNSIVTDLKAVLASREHEIDKESYEGMLKKLENVTQVTNKDALSRPFKDLQFILNDEDQETLKHRNTYLHGRSHPEESPIEVADIESYYWALRAFSLIAVLILKPTGYDNYIVNYPRVYQKTCKRDLDEGHYRPI